LGQFFDVVTALNKVETPSRPDIGSNKDSSLTVEIKRPGIPAIFREHSNALVTGW
jgi:hypothetical protein